MWKIRSIQANADVQKVTADAGQASQELQAAMEEYRKLDGETKEIAERAKLLHTELVATMDEKGKTDEEKAELIRVFIPYSKGCYLITGNSGRYLGRGAGSGTRGGRKQSPNKSTYYHRWRYGNVRKTSQGYSRD